MAFVVAPFYICMYVYKIHLTVKFVWASIYLKSISEVEM